MMPRVCLILCLALAASAQATEAGLARADLLRFADGLECYHAEFTQRVWTPEGELQEEGEGEVWMRRPDQFRWRYGGEFPELIVADGERVWLFDETLEQVTVREQSGLPENSPLMLLTDLSGLDEQFTVTELGSDEGLHLLELTSDSADAEFDRVILGLADGELRLMIMEDAFGLRTEITYGDAQRNPELDSGLFEFTPPPGVDVIGDLEPAAP